MSLRRICIVAQVTGPQCYNAGKPEETPLAVNMLNIEGLERLDPQAPVVMLNLMPPALA